VCTRVSCLRESAVAVRRASPSAPARTCGDSAAGSWSCSTACACRAWRCAARLARSVAMSGGDRVHQQGLERRSHTRDLLSTKNAIAPLEARLGTLAAGAPVFTAQGRQVI
jgi:hypothetical protein